MVEEKFIGTSCYFEEYLDTKFSQQAQASLPMQNELFVATWRDYEKQALQRKLLETLRSQLVQFNFPIKAGISKEKAYGEATLKGNNLAGNALASGLKLIEPSGIKLLFLKGPVGELPVLKVKNPDDFANIVRALAHKNEPIAIPNSMGAALIRGLNNWGRINTLKANWLKIKELNTWALEFQKNILPKKDTYQDTIMVLSEKAYSGVGHEELGFSRSDWLKKSMGIRMFHEYAHYFTLRFYGEMSINIYDELLADYLGIAMTYGLYDSDLFLKCVGLENYPKYRKGGRFENYLDSNLLTKKEHFKIQELCFKSSKTMEKFDYHLGYSKDINERIYRLKVLCSKDLIDLAREGAVWGLLKAYQSVKRKA